MNELLTLESQTLDNWPQREKVSKVTVAEGKRVNPNQSLPRTTWKITTAESPNANDHLRDSHNSCFQQTTTKAILNGDALTFQPCFNQNIFKKNRTSNNKSNRIFDYVSYKVGLHDISHVIFNAHLVSKAGPVIRCNFTLPHRADVH